MQVQGTHRCSKCGYNGLDIAFERTQDLIQKDLLLDEESVYSPHANSLNTYGGESNMVEIDRPQETAFLKAKLVVERIFPPNDLIDRYSISPI